MKILQVIPSLDTGGAQKLLENLVPLLKKDNEVTVVVYKNSDSAIQKSIENSGVNFISLGISVRSTKAIFKLRRYFKAADVVHLHLFPTHYHGFLANIGIGKPLIFTEHSTYNRRRGYKFLKPLEKLVYSHLSKIVSISKDVEKALKEWIGLTQDKDKFVVIENGIDLKPFINAPACSSKEVFGKEGYPILMIGRLTAAKDFETVIRSLQYIQRPDIFLVIAGSGEKENELKKLIGNLSLESRVIMLGEREDVPCLIKASKIGVLSSNWEGFGIAALEMMAGGLPVVASDIEGLRELACNVGILFEKGNEKDLASKLNHLSRDLDLYWKIASRCQKKAEDYDIHRTYLKYMNLYVS